MFSTVRNQTTTTNDQFLASILSAQNASLGWPLSVLPLAQQRFYQEVNQQQMREPRQQQMNFRTKDTKRIHPMKNESTTISPAVNDNFNANGDLRRSASEQDLSKVECEMQTRSAIGGQLSPNLLNSTVTTESHGSKGVGFSSGDSFVSAYSGVGFAPPQRTANGPNMHSPNNSGAGSSNSATVAAPIFLPPNHHQSLSSFNRNNPLPSPPITHLHKLHRGELSINEKYRYDLSRAQLKASSRTSALLSGFAMIALVELQYMPDTPRPMLIMLGVVTTLLVSVHLLALMMSTCLLPYIEANGCTQDSPHIKLKFYIELSWIFSTCIGLLLFLLEIGVIFFVKFNAVGYNTAAYITTGMLVPVLIIFVVISYLIHRNRFTHSIERVNDKVVDLQKYLAESDVHNLPQSNSVHRNMVNAGLQGVTVVRNYKD